MASLNGPFEPEKANVTFTSGGRIILSESDANEELNQYNQNTCVVFILLTEVEQDRLRGQMRALVGKCPGFRTKFVPDVIRNRLAVVTCRASPFARGAAACQCSVDSLGGLILDTFQAHGDGHVSCRQYLSHQARMLLGSMLKGTEPLDEVKFITVGTLERIPDGPNLRDLNKHLAGLVWRTTFSLTNLKRLEHRRWWSLFIKRSIGTWVLSHLEATVEHLEASDPDPDKTIESRIKTAEQIETSRSRQCLATWGDVSEIKDPSDERGNFGNLKPHKSREHKAEARKKKPPAKEKKYVQPAKGFFGQEKKTFEEDVPEQSFSRSRADQSSPRSRSEQFHQSQSKNASGILKNSFAASTPLVGPEKPGDSGPRTTPREKVITGANTLDPQNSEKKWESGTSISKERMTEVSQRLLARSLERRQADRPRSHSRPSASGPDRPEFVSPTPARKVSSRKRVSLVDRMTGLQPQFSEKPLYPGEDLKNMEEYKASQLRAPPQKSVELREDLNQPPPLEDDDVEMTDEETFRTAVDHSSTLIDSNGNEEERERSSTPLQDEFGLPLPDPDILEKVDLDSSKTEQTHRMVIAMDAKAVSTSLPASLLESDPQMAEQVLLTTGKPLVDASSSLLDMSPSFSNRQQKKINSAVNLKVRVSQLNQQMNSLARERGQCLKMMESELSTLMAYDPSKYEFVEKEKRMSRKKVDIEIARKQQEIKQMKRHRRMMDKRELDGEPYDFDWMETQKPPENASDHDYESVSDVSDEIHGNRSEDPPPLFSEINAKAERVIRTVEDDQNSREMEVPNAPETEAEKERTETSDTPPENLLDFK